jgi:2-polyprenyl-3-methyl-5-hydroxy-6-metoxy-1,4-benzoquinol methylase
LDHNSRYHSVVLNAVPAGCQRALDIGCGLGALSRRLRDRADHVTGIDADPKSIELARTHPDAAGINYVHGDFLGFGFEPGTFDMISAVASLHHMKAESALIRMQSLLRPGGVLAIIGLARGSSLSDALLAIPAFIGAWLHPLTAADDAGKPSGYQAPLLWPAPVTYQEMRQLAARTLPGVRYRRHLYWRYSLVWTKP